MMLFFQQTSKKAKPKEINTCAILMDDVFSFWLGAMVATLHPGKLTWNPKMEI